MNMLRKHPHKATIGWRGTQCYWKELINYGRKKCNLDTPDTSSQNNLICMINEVQKKKNPENKYRYLLALENTNFKGPRKQSL